MLFNLLYPFWMVLTIFLDLGANKAAVAANKAKIAELEYDFALRLQIMCWLLKRYYNLDVVVVSGRRSAAQQDALHAADPRNPPAKQGSSHQSGKAADLNFWLNGSAYLLKASPRAKWLLVYRVADLCGLDNGSLFVGYPDNNHIFKK